MHLVTSQAIVTSPGDVTIRIGTPRGCERIAVAAGHGVSVPVLVIGSTADDACTPSHTQRLFASITHDRKQLHMVQGATHYYTGPDGKAYMSEAVGVVGDFLTAQLETS